MPVLRLSLLFAALLACLASVLNPDSDIPQTDSCDSASQASVDALAILWGPSAGTESELQDEHASSFADAGPREAGRTDAGLAIDAGP